MVALPRSAGGAKAGPDRRDLTVSTAGCTLRYDNSDGDWIIYDYNHAAQCLTVSASLPWELCIPPLTGVVCGVLLSLRQHTLLHGACLELEGASIALLGASGHGKSTLAAALVREGARLVTEDLLVSVQTPSGWIVEVGAPSLHLLSDSYAALGADLAGPAEAAARVRAGKYVIDMPSAAAQSSVGPSLLTGIYVLDPPTRNVCARLTKLSGRHALMRVMDHLYGAAWIRTVTQSDLRFCAALVAQVPVYALSRPWRLDKIAEVATMLRQVNRPI